MGWQKWEVADVSVYKCGHKTLHTLQNDAWSHAPWTDQLISVLKNLDWIVNGSVMWENTATMWWISATSVPGLKWQADKSF